MRLYMPLASSCSYNTIVVVMGMKCGITTISKGTARAGLIGAIDIETVVSYYCTFASRDDLRCQDEANRRSIPKTALESRNENREFALSRTT